MGMSKYRMQPDPADAMIKRALDWVETSLVYDIPVMTEYSAFSRALLIAAARQADVDTMIEITQDMVARSMHFLHESDILDTSALITYPHFMRELLVVALREAMPGKPSAKIIPLLDSLAPV